MLKKFKKYWIGEILDDAPDIFEKSRAELVYRLTMSFLLLYVGMIIHFSTLNTSAAVDIVNYGSLIGIIAALPIMKLSRSYFAGALVFWIVGTLTQVSMVFLSNGEAFLQVGVWHSFSIVSSFLLLGRTLGIISSVFSILLTVLVELNSINSWDLFNIGLERGEGLENDPVAIIIPMTASAYMLWLFIRTRDRAQKVIADQKEREMTHRKQIEEKSKEITDSIIYAKRIQQAILPPLSLFKETLPNSFVLYLPKDVVAGDFYWLEKTEEAAYFAAADCTGHGVPGAMVSVVCNNALNRCVREYGLNSPGAILDKTRELVIQEFEKSEEEVRDGMDIALCMLKGNTLTYAGAHNPLWILRKGSNEIDVIKANKQPIGSFDYPEPYIDHTITVNKGDRIYIFSDGFADQFGGESTHGAKNGGKKLKAANFKKMLLSLSDQKMTDQSEILKKGFEDWKGDIEQIDDVCVIGLEF